MKLTNAQYRAWLQMCMEIIEANGGDFSNHKLTLNGDGQTTGGVVGDDPTKTYELPSECFALPA